MNSKLILAFSILVTSSAWAQRATLFPIRSSAEIESACRTKAKEVAAETYRGCVIDTKTAQLEQIKKDYQAQLKALKSHYESELRKMSSAKAALKTQDAGAENLSPEAVSAAEPGVQKPFQPEQTPPQSMPGSSTQVAPQNPEVPTNSPNTVIESVPSTGVEEAPSASTPGTPVESGSPEPSAEPVDSNDVKVVQTVDSPNSSGEVEVTSENTNPTGNMPGEVGDPPAVSGSSTEMIPQKATLPAKKASKNPSPARVKGASQSKPVKTPARSEMKVVLKKEIPSGSKKELAAPNKVAVKSKAPPALQPSTPPSRPVSVVAIGKKPMAPKKITASQGLSPNEMTVKLKRGPVVPTQDESTMDIPEPIPVENILKKSSI